MSYTVAVTLTEEQYAAIDAFLRPQLKQRLDEVTGRSITEPVYPGGAEEFLAASLGKLLEGIIHDRPSAAVREKQIAIKVLQDEIVGLAQPIVVVKKIAT